MQRIALSAWAALMVAGCSCGDGGGPRRDAGDATDASLVDGSSFDAAPAEDAAPLDAPVAPTDTGFDARIDRTAFCMGMGPAVLVGDTTSSTATCAGSIAARVFDHALCTCTDANVGGYMRTRSFDSGVGPMDTASGAPVGIDQTYTTGGYADVGGSFVIAGSTSVRFAGYLKVGGDARFGGDVQAASYIDVDRDLWVLGDVTNLGLLSVGRDVHQPSGRTLATFPDIGGSRIRSPFTVDPPCGCAPSELVDIGALIADARVHNDNADVGLASNVLSSVTGIGVEVTLPCGRYYLTEIVGLGSITVHVPGRTALFVDGDLNALGVFDIDLGPTGELDLFIGGNILSIGRGRYGDPARPARTRIYVGGTGDVTLVGATDFVGNVYAPRARITAPGATTVYGSLFGRRVDMPGYLDIRYDRAILDADADCPSTGECGGCDGEGCTDDRACVGGMCAACGSDADCCAPLVCYPDGTCGSLLI